MIAAEYNEKDKCWVQRIPYKPYYKVIEVSAILQTGSVQIRGWIKRGTIRAYRVAGVVSIKHEDLVNYIARRGQAAVATGELLIEEIIPEKKASRAVTAASLVDGEDLDEDDLSFLDEEGEGEDEE